MTRAAELTSNTWIHPAIQAYVIRRSSRERMSGQSGAEATHSKTRAAKSALGTDGHVLECASALAL
jgi:hypothetical protein